MKYRWPQTGGQQRGVQARIPLFATNKERDQAK